MRLLADESLDFAVVRALRGAGHDVSAISETAPGEPDSAVVKRARDEGRVLLTEDRDFGQLVFAGSQQASGVVYVRFPAVARRLQAAADLDAVERLGDRLLGSFVVVEPGKIRITSTP